MLTEKDLTLITLLKENGRMSVADLARKLNVSRTAAQARLEKLENNGTIAGYSLRLGQEVSAHQVKALVMIKAPPRVRTSVEAHLKKIHALSALYSISGAFDLACVLSAQSVSALDHVIDVIGNIEGVTDTMSSVILSTKIDR